MGAEGSYEFVAEVLLNELDVDGFFMEFDDERSGGFEPLRFLPKGKLVVLGLVTTKSGELEQKDELKRRIEEAARFADIDQLCLSPQCGFSSTVEGNALTARRSSPRSCGSWSRRPARSGASLQAQRDERDGEQHVRGRERAQRELGRCGQGVDVERLARLARPLDVALDAQPAAAQAPRPVGERALGEARRGRERRTEHHRSSIDPVWAKPPTSTGNAPQPSAKTWSVWRAPPNSSRL